MTRASAWVATRYGGPEVLTRVEADVPAPGPGQVTIEVQAAGVNPADYKHFAPGQDPGRRIVTTAAFGRAAADGFRSVGAANPASGPFRAQARARVIALAAAGDLTVPIARTFPFAQAPAALALLRGPHPAGKLVLITGD